MSICSGSTYADNTNVDQKAGTLGDAAMNREPIAVSLTSLNVYQNKFIRIFLFFIVACLMGNCVIFLLQFIVHFLF